MYQISTTHETDISKDSYQDFPALNPINNSVESHVPYTLLRQNQVGRGVSWTRTLEQLLCDLAEVETPTCYFDVTSKPKDAQLSRTKCLSIIYSFSITHYFLSLFVPLFVPLF